MNMRERIKNKHTIKQVFCYNVKFFIGQSIDKCSIVAYLCAVNLIDAQIKRFLIKKATKMTTAVQPTTTTRFRYIDPTDDIIYVGEAEIVDFLDDLGEPLIDIAILSAWRYGVTIEEVFPYEKGFPAGLRSSFIQSALEQQTCYQVELPTDWDELEVLDTEMIYTIQIKAIIPDVETDTEAKEYGLSAVCRVHRINGGKQYRITAKGGIDEVRRELHRIRIF